MPSVPQSASAQTAAPVVSQPTPQALAAIKRFVTDGTWPKPGTMPVCIRLGR